jgi:hypothetical protein
MSDLAELFARDPLEYSQQDLSDIIRVMREKRKQFNLGNAKAGSTKPLTPKAKESLAIADKLGLKLDL